MRPVIITRQLPPSSVVPARRPAPAFESLDDLLLELASQVGGCRRDASDVIERGLVLIAEQAEAAHGS